jgi:Restriction endonuclease
VVCAALCFATSGTGDILREFVSVTSTDCKAMYDFLALSPLDFEELIRDLLQEELGILLESFGPGRDKGIDFRHSAAGHSTVVQAKHYGRSGNKQLLRAARLENKKVKALWPAVQRYILATSVSLSPGLKTQLVAAMPDTPLNSPVTKSRFFSFASGLQRR